MRSRDAELRIEGKGSGGKKQNFAQDYVKNQLTKKLNKKRLE